METEQNRDSILTDCFSPIAMTAKAKSKYHLFGGFYYAELEAVFGVGFPELFLDCLVFF